MSRGKRPWGCWAKTLGEKTSGRARENRRRAHCSGASAGEKAAGLKRSLDRHRNIVRRSDECLLA